MTKLTFQKSGLPICMMFNRGKEYKSKVKNCRDIVHISIDTDFEARTQPSRKRSTFEAEVYKPCSGVIDLVTEEENDREDAEGEMNYRDFVNISTDIEFEAKSQLSRKRDTIEAEVYKPCSSIIDLVEEEENDRIDAEGEMIYRFNLENRQNNPYCGVYYYSSR